MALDIPHIADHPHRHQPRRGSARLRRRTRRAGLLPGPAVGHRHAHPLHPHHPAQHPHHLRRHGHRQRGPDGHRHGPAGRHRRHPQEPGSRRAGRAGPPRQEVRVRHGGEPAHHPPRPDARRCPRPDDHQPHQRHPGGGARHQPPGRHRHQPRRPLRLGPHAEGLRTDDAGGPGDGRRPASRRTRPAGCCTATASRSCWWWTMPTAASG